MFKDPVKDQADILSDFMVMGYHIPGRQIRTSHDLLPSMLQNLLEMPWDFPAYQPDGMEYVKGLVNKLGLDGPGKK